MARTYVKVDGSWLRVVEGWVREGGEWKKLSDIYVRQGGEWRKVYERVLYIDFWDSAQDVNLREKFEEVHGTPRRYSRAIFRIQSDASIIASSTSTPALRTDTFPAGFLIKGIYIGGVVAGAGGRGGDTSPDTTEDVYEPPTDSGDPGGLALLVEHPVEELRGSGIVGGGGGGGGAGGLSFVGNSSAIAGSGGGGASYGTPGDVDARLSGRDYSCKGNKGEEGGETQGGAGGSGCRVDYDYDSGSGTLYSGDGGDGGDLGESGSDGESGSRSNGDTVQPGGSGGSPGKAIEGYDQIDTVSLGDIRGPTD